MNGRWRSRLQGTVTTGVALAVMAALFLAGALVLAACSGWGTTAYTSPGLAAPTVAADQQAMPLPAPTAAGTLAFARVTSVHDGAYIVRTGDICVVRTDGTGLTPLAAGAADQEQPAWSPDGRQIAYTTYRLADEPRCTVRIMSADGSGKRRLLQLAIAGEWPAWSRDGTLVAFFHPPGEVQDWFTGQPRLVVADASGEHFSSPGWPRIDGEGGRSGRFAAWAPDGSIYFLMSRLGDVFSGGSFGGFLTRITTGGGHGAFALSQDGAQLALYDHEHDHLVVQSESGTGTPLVIVDDVSRFVPSESVRLSWSPDGSAIAFAASSDRTRTLYPRGSALYIVNADGSGLSMVPDTGKVWDPAWRPE